MAAIETGRHKWPGMKLNDGHPLARHVVAAYMMNPRTPAPAAGSPPDIIDLSNWHSHATVAGSPLPTYVNGPLGWEMNFSRSGGYGIVTKFASATWPAGALAVSVEAYVKFTGGTEVNEFGIAGLWFATQSFLLVYDSTTNELEFSINASGGSASWNTGVDIDDGEYHHIVAIYDSIAQYQRIYLDGVLAASVARNLGVLIAGAVSRNLYIGSWFTTLEQWDGRIAFLRIYDTNISTQVARLYAMPFEMFRNRKLLSVAPANPCLLSAVADATGPTVPVASDTWDGRVPEDF